MKIEKTIAGWAEALFQAQKDKSDQEKKRMVFQLTKLLQKAKKTFLLKEILERAQEKKERESKVELILSRSHRPGFLRELKAKLSAIFGKDKEVAVKTEADLGAGFRIKTNALLIRASLKDFIFDLWKK